MYDLAKVLGTLVGLVLGTVVMATIFALIVGVPLMLLWDAVMPALFGLKTITLLQSMGLILITHILIPSKSSSNDEK